MQSELLLLVDTCVKKNSAAWLDEVVLANYWNDNLRQLIVQVDQESTRELMA